MSSRAPPGPSVKPKLHKCTPLCTNKETCDGCLPGCGPLPPRKERTLITLFKEWPVEEAWAFGSLTPGQEVYAHLHLPQLGEVAPAVYTCEVIGLRQNTPDDMKEMDRVYDVRLQLQTKTYYLEVKRSCMLAHRREMNKAALEPIADHCALLFGVKEAQIRWDHWTKHGVVQSEEWQAFSQKFYDQQG